MKHRTSAILLCVLGVILSWLLPTIVGAIHDAHGMSTAHEFQVYRLIDQERLEAVKAEYDMPDYSVEQRVRAVGGLHMYLPVVTAILATLFGAVGILAWMSDPDSSAVSATSLANKIMNSDGLEFVADWDSHRHEIVHEPDVGFYVYRYDGRGPRTTHDYLQDDIEMAKSCAEDEFGVPAKAWRTADVNEAPACKQASQ